MKQLKITTKITSRESISLDKYLLEIGRIELLTPEQENDLALRIVAGDESAVELLTKANLRFVVSVAKQYQSPGLSLVDLINEGNLGLMRAAQRFDPSKGFKFITYAVWWIRQAIMNAITAQGRLIKLPQHKQTTFRKMQEVIKEFHQQNEREPSRREISELMTLTLNEVAELMQYRERTTSIDSPVLGEESTMTVLDTIVGDGPLPDSGLMRDSVSVDLKQQLSKLPFREHQVLVRSFGIGNQIERSLSDIAEEFGLTRERVRQIRERALRNLRRRVIQSKAMIA